MINFVFSKKHRKSDEMLNNITKHFVKNDSFGASKKSYIVKPYMYTAELENDVTITACEYGTADNSDVKRYCIVSHRDAKEEVVVDGWNFLNEIYLHIKQICTDLNRF